MSLLDCEKCWQIPCICGWDYRKWPVKDLSEMVRVLNDVILFKQSFPNAKFSDLSEPMTEDDKNFMKFVK